MDADDSNPVGVEFVGTIVVDAVGGEAGGSSQWIQLRHRQLCRCSSCIKANVHRRASTISLYMIICKYLLHNSLNKNIGCTDAVSCLRLS